jgi:hypothetical protein
MPAAAGVLGAGILAGNDALTRGRNGAAMAGWAKRLTQRKYLYVTETVDVLWLAQTKGAPAFIRDTASQLRIITERRCLTRSSLYRSPPPKAKLD